VILTRFTPVNVSTALRHWDLHSPLSLQEILEQNLSLLHVATEKCFHISKLNFRAGYRRVRFEEAVARKPKEVVSGADNNWWSLYECFDKRILTQQIGPRRTEMHIDTRQCRTRSMGTSQYAER